MVSLRIVISRINKYEEWVKINYNNIIFTLDGRLWIIY